MDHWHVILSDYGSAEAGEVVTKDGEVIGTWTLDAEGHPGFIPFGESDVVVWSSWIGPFCKAVLEWHEHKEQQANGSVQ